jgi:hypothetical protein
MSDLESCGGSYQLAVACFHHEHLPAVDFLEPSWSTNLGRNSHLLLMIKTIKFFTKL